MLHHFVQRLIIFVVNAAQVFQMDPNTNYDFHTAGKYTLKGKPPVPVGKLDQLAR